MATFVPISYTYVPTAPRSKSAAARHKPASKQSSVLDKFQCSKLAGAALDSPRLPAPAAADNNRSEIQEISAEMGTFYDGSDDDFPTIEEILYTTLQKKGFTTEDRGLDNTVLGVEEVASVRRGFINLTRSASGDNLGGSLDNPIDLLGTDDSSASEAEVDDGGLRAESAASDAGVFESPETAVDSTTPALSSSPDGSHDIERYDFLETAPHLRLAEQGASTSNSKRPCGPTSRLSSELLHDSISAKGLDTRHARSEVTASHSACPRSPPPRQSRMLPENQLSQEDCLYTGRGKADKHELIGPALNIDAIDKGERQQQELEQEEDEANDEDDGEQEEVNNVAAVVTAERVGDTHLSDEEDGSLRPAEHQRPLPSRDPLPEPSHNEAESRSDGDSDDELHNKADSDEDDGEPHPAKRKRPFSSYDGPTHKKRKHYLQWRSTRQPKPRSKSCRYSSKSHSVLDQGSGISVRSRVEGRLPSPAHSTPQIIDREMSSDCSDLGGSSRNTLPTLIEVTFRPHSPNCFSFTAVVQDGCDGRGISFGQLARLIESTGHIGKIDDFTIKPTKQHLFLVTGFSWHALSRLSSSGTTVLTAVEVGPTHKGATCIRPQHGKAVDAEALALKGSKPSNNDDDGSLSDNDSDPSSGDDGCSGEGEQERSSISKHSRWSDLDEQRLLAYKKEGKPWSWIFYQFRGRTPAAVRTRWNMVRPRIE